MASDNLYQLPDDLPVPPDDGGAQHLAGMVLPELMLSSTEGAAISLARLLARTAVYCYPRTGRPGEELPLGWNEIPGARGCTPQACTFRDHHDEFRPLGASVYGLSTQSMEEQHEVVDRLHLPFPLLSDASHLLCDALKLPTREIEGTMLIKRLTLIIAGGQIDHVFYPVFPPDRHAKEVLAWLAHRAITELN
jgi:peroxiredoxin